MRTVLKIMTQKNLDHLVKTSALNDLKNKTIQGNGFFSNAGLLDAWQLRDRDKMNFVKEKLDGKINANYMVDVSLEEGDGEMTKYLIHKFDAKPSLYAKQMAEINGHITLAKEIESYYELRNAVSIAHVHRKMGKDKKMRWSDCIPLEYQFL